MSGSRSEDRAGSPIMERRLERIEDKLDRLTEGIATLVRVEERMNAQQRRQDEHERVQRETMARLGDIERVTLGRGIFFRWVDRGAVALVSVSAALLVQLLFKVGV